MMTDSKTDTVQKPIYLHFAIYGNFIQRFFRFRKLQRAVNFLRSQGVEVELLYAKD